MSYKAVLADPICKKLLERLPWVLDGELQQQDMLIHALIGEEARFKELDKYPKFSLITPMWNTPVPFLEELIATCRMQTWGHWELLLVDDASPNREHIAIAESWAKKDQRIRFIQGKKNKGISGARNSAIAVATGEFVGILDHDDMLHPQVLGLFARYLRRYPTVNFLYCNEVKVNEASIKISEFYSKPDFDLATLERSNYICHFTVLKRDLLDEARTGTDEWFRSKYDGVEDHDLFLRAARVPGFNPAHLPVFGYYWRRTAGSTAENLEEKPYVFERGNNLIREYLAVAGDVVQAKSKRGENLFYSIHFTPLSQQKLAVIIPYRDQLDITKKCIDSLLAQRHDLDVTLVLVNNNSESHTINNLKSYLQSLTKVKIIWHSHAGAFNFARINNEAIKALREKPDYILLLNNDVELLTPTALSVMAGELAHHNKTAFVGIKLWFPGQQSLQHAGVKILPPVSGLGFHRSEHILHGREYAHDEHVVFSVSFACAMTRYDTWQELGGLEEEFFPNGYGDLEMCVRARQKGYNNFYLGTVEATHYESKSRKTNAEELEASMLSLMYAGDLTHARRVQLGYDLHLGWNNSSGPQSNWFEMHLRYRIADKINNWIKRMAGPVHKLLKRRLQSS